MTFGYKILKIGLKKEFHVVVFTSYKNTLEKNSNGTKARM